MRVLTLAFTLALSPALPSLVRAEDSPAAEPEKATAAALKTLEGVPERFSRVTDSAKARWGLVKDGAIALSGYAGTRMESFTTAGRLTVEGAVFDPAAAQATEDGSHVVLKGKAKDFEVTRDVWIDATRGGARFIETVSNPGETSMTVAVAVRNEFGEGVKSLHKLDGRPLGNDGLGKEDAGFVVMQEPESNKATVIFLTGDPKSDAKAKLEAKDTNRDLVWTVRLPAKGKASVLWWVLQRPDLTPELAKGAAEPFWRNGRLVRPVVDAETAKTVANHTIKAADQGGSSEVPAAGDWLGPLAAFCERLGLERGKDDIYWMGANSSLTGEVQGAPLTLESRFGKLTVPLAEVAAVQGAAGRGRLPRVFLRDGTVLAGALTLPDWKVAGEKGWTIGLNAETLDTVILRASDTDGPKDASAQLLVQLSSGDILPLQPAAGQKLALTTPWGALETDLGAVAALWRLHEPAPACRLRLRDGSQLTVFPAAKALVAKSPRFDAISLDAADLAAVWLPGEDLPAGRNEIEEITSLDGFEKAFVLLKGSNALAATLADPTLTLLTGAARMDLKAADIRDLRRTEASPDSAPRFRVTLSSGAEFEGTLATGAVTVQPHGAAPWTVPVAHLLAAQRGE